MFIQGSHTEADSNRVLLYAGSRGDALPTGTTKVKREQTRQETRVVSRRSHMLGLAEGFRLLDSVT